jgi:deoxyribose-phosphate aldolase
MTDHPLSTSELAQRIDHTLLKPTLTDSDLEALCREAVEYRFKTVCVPPASVRTSVALLQGTSVATITVVGFPLGYSTSLSKAAEAEEAISEGAREIDMVINLSYLKSGRWSDVEKDIARVVKACGPVPLKVIIETAYLTEKEKLEAALSSERAGAAFVKTSTGFASGVAHAGATVEDVQLLRRVLKPSTRIKASGGIRDLPGARALIAAGADRLGTSSGVALIRGLRSEEGY